MMRHSVAAAILWTALAASSVRPAAQEATLSAGPGTSAALPCNDVVLQLELTACWASAAAAEEAVVEARWLKAAAAVQLRGGGDAFTLLRNTQDQWAHYRDSSCALSGKRYAGGSAEAMAASVCRWQMASQRAGELQTVSESWDEEP